MVYEYIVDGAASGLFAILLLKSFYSVYILSKKQDVTWSI